MLSLDRVCGLPEFGGRVEGFIDRWAQNKNSGMSDSDAGAKVGRGVPDQAWLRHLRHS